MTFNTVIFDFGGVITASPFEAFNRMEAERGLPLDFVRRVNSTNPDNNAWAKFERAEIDAAAFDFLFAKEAEALGHRLEGALVIACLSGDIRPYMVTALERLKSAGFKLGCITNNVASGKGAGMAEIGREAELRVRRSAAQSPGLLAAIVRKHGTQRVKSSSCRDWRC